MMLSARNISKNIDGKTIIRSVSLHVDKGKCLAILGPNGSGKSVLLRALAMTDPPSSGSLCINGKSWVFGSESPRPHTPPWPNLTMVFQQLFLWPHLSLLENIMLGIGGKRALPERDRLSRELIDRLDLGSVVNNLPNQVSHGQRQLTALIRALVLKPQILLLDEVTSALDLRQMGRVRDLLSEYKKDEQLSLIVVTHLIGFASSLADEYAFVESGCILDAGRTIDELAQRCDLFAQFLLWQEHFNDVNGNGHSSSSFVEQ